MKKYKVEMEIETHDILDHKDGIITAVELKQLIEFETYGQIKVNSIIANDANANADDGWYCEHSPTHKCDYLHFLDGYNEDCCIYCGEPYERK